MKNIFKIIGILLLAVVFTVSCSRDDDPADNDFFAGTYKGEVSYKDSSSDISTTDGSVFVTKIGNSSKYNFAFSNSIPDLNDIEFTKTGSNTMVNVGNNANAYITINNSDLDILYIKDGKRWYANCKR